MYLCQEIESLSELTKWFAPKSLLEGLAIDVGNNFVNFSKKKGKYTIERERKRDGNKELQGRQPFRAR